MLQENLLQEKDNKTNFVSCAFLRASSWTNKLQRKVDGVVDGSGWAVIVGVVGYQGDSQVASYSLSGVVEGERRQGRRTWT